MTTAILPTSSKMRGDTRADPYADGDGRFEVVKGARVEKQPVGLIENMIASMLLARLGPFSAANNLGWAVSETPFTLPGRGNDRRPDVAFVSFGKWPKTRPIPRVNAWDIAPDLAVEVISPSDKGFDVLEKMTEYFDSGVQVVWHIYSHVEQVYVYTSPTSVRILTRGDELTGEPVIPGFRLQLADLFPLAAPTP